MRMYRGSVSEFGERFRQEGCENGGLGLNGDAKTNDGENLLGGLGFCFYLTRVLQSWLTFPSFRFPVTRNSLHDKRDQIHESKEEKKRRQKRINTHTLPSFSSPFLFTLNLIKPDDSKLTLILFPPNSKLFILP